MDGIIKVAVFRQLHIGKNRLYDMSGDLLTKLPGDF